MYHSHHVTSELAKARVDEMRRAAFDRPAKPRSSRRRRRIRIPLALPAALIGLAALLPACGGDGAERVSCTSEPAVRSSGAAETTLPGRIVFSSDRADGNLDLFVMNANGSGIRRLTATPANEVMPVWSPDGTRIAYLSFEDDLATLDADVSPGQVKVMQADGSAVRALTSPEPQTGAVTWSPDGERIAFAFQGDIHIMGADASGRRAVAGVDADQYWPSWSPDGDEILVTSSRSGREELMTIGVDGSDPTRLSQLGSEGAWSPDGRRIAFASGRDGDPDARDPVDWNEEIYVTAADGSRVTRITRIPGNDHWPPTWSPDGAFIAFTSDGCKEDSEIFIGDARGGGRIWNATHHPALDLFPSWHR